MFFLVRVAAWLVGVRSVGVDREDISGSSPRWARRSSTPHCSGSRTSAVEPYIRKLSPDSLIGWTRLIGGRWRDPLVARDVLLGVSRGTRDDGALRVAQPAAAAVRPSRADAAGAGEPTCCSAPASSSPASSQFGTALSGMLAVVGVVAIMIPLKRKWATHIVGSLIYVWVVIHGMFSPATPMLDFLSASGSS